MYFVALQLLHMRISAYTSSSIIQNPCISYFWNYYNALHGIIDGGVSRHQDLIPQTMVSSNARSNCAVCTELQSIVAGSNIQLMAGHIPSTSHLLLRQYYQYWMLQYRYPSITAYGKTRRSTVIATGVV
mmetsp:Transcript_27358/g.40400  ORF Transcript_27358/g.40400 Transcript_27358/m.40400 type:complete len:129 (-) Transcript_27358:266-652(-)